jgi:hypothetical protein
LAFYFRQRKCPKYIAHIKEFEEQLLPTKIIEQIGHGLVLLIENGEINSKEMNELLHVYLEPMIAANIDYLVLGCSHYPYLIPQIKKILPKEIKIIDSGEAVARQTKNILLERNGLNDEKNKGKAIFYTNSNISKQDKIELEQRRRNQIYKNFDYILSSITYFDFFSLDAFNITKKAKKIAHYYQKENVNNEILLISFIYSNTQISKLLEEYGLNKNNLEFLCDYQLNRK